MIVDFAKEKIVYVVNGKAALTSEILQKQGVGVERFDVGHLRGQHSEFQLYFGS